MRQSKIPYNSDGPLAGELSGAKENPTLYIQHASHWVREAAAKSENATQIELSRLAKDSHRKVREFARTNPRFGRVAKILAYLNVLD